MKKTVVMKFGGTSVGSLERIENIVSIVLDHRAVTGNDVVVVVSAMSGETDRLISLAKQASGGSIPDREYHQLLVTGEQVSASLVAMVFIRCGVEARSMLAHQVGVYSKNILGQNMIHEIDRHKIQLLLDDGIVPVIAGFQAVDEKGNFTTLGRGGSDTTAVAIAAALDSCPCYIYTDVDGVYTALPSICPAARKQDKLSYEEMLELASGGAKVLHTRSVSLAHRYKVPLVVCSSFVRTTGTEIVEDYQGMEDALVSGITHKIDEAKIALRNIPDKPGTAAKIFHSIYQMGIIVDMIVQSEGIGGKAEISFTIPEQDSQRTYELMIALAKGDYPEMTVDLDTNVAKLSVVGEGMRNHAGVAATMFKVLAREGINIELITTSEIKICVVIKSKYAELAVRSLHEAFLQ